jgi:spore coat protein A
MHGAKAPPASDGYPEDWYVPGKSATYYYPNEQSPALLWYHDHAMGINRLNIYAGLLGLCIIRDKVEDSLGLPSGEYEIPLVIFDRMLTPDGQLYYPVSKRPEAPWIPEFFGNAILVNGKLLPYLDVKRSKYRFRVLNASNARFYHFSLANGQPFAQIGMDQGLLPAPVEVQTLTLAPGERADLVIDFALARPGENIVLRNDTAVVMQFRVGNTPVVNSRPLPSTLRPVPKIPEQAAIRTRELTLEEFDNVLDEPETHLLNGARWHDPVTESPTINTTEIWSLINLTDDVHPIHLHLVRFQILDRRPLDVDEYLLKKTIRYTGPAFPPEANEAGWKDTVRATPAAVTRIIVTFEGFTGRYVWHCHLLEHEDNEMMRPYDVVAKSN